MSFIPTAEQASIIEVARTTKDNILISALAGCAKTSTLHMIVKALPVQPTLALAFNRRIATEMKTRMPFHCECSTLNSLGHRSWSTKIATRLTLSADKIPDLLKDYISSAPKSERSPLWDNFSPITRTIRAARTQGVLSPHYETLHPDVGLIPFDEFISDPDDELDLDESLLREVVATILTQSTAHAFEGRIDYDDQLYMPTLFGGLFPNYRLTLVDEAQDLSPLNHAMLARVVRQRLIAVGDDNQSIYGFRGAQVGGMALLKSRWSMTELPLSVTFRCPQAIVRRAQARVPHFRWAEGAPEGAVINHAYRETRFDLAELPPEDEINLWTTSSIPEGSAIICRNNAPLLTVALALIRAGRGIDLVGNDLGPQLIRALRKMGEPSLSSEALLDAITAWEAARIKKRPRSEGATRDRADCLRIFAESSSNLGQAITRAETIFNSKGPIQLLSIHKAKGLEWDVVYHLDPWRIPNKYVEAETQAYAQELNCRYVCETRARQTLILVNAKDLISSKIRS